MNLFALVEFHCLRASVRRALRCSLRFFIHRSIMRICWLFNAVAVVDHRSKHSLQMAHTCLPRLFALLLRIKVELVTLLYRFWVKWCGYGMLCLLFL